MIDTTKTCKNCGNEFKENFCNRCGQMEAHRLTINHIFHETVHTFLHADKGIFQFVYRLVSRPGIMAREFVEGKRRMFNPMQYLIIIVGIIAFLMARSNFYEDMAKLNDKNFEKLPAIFRESYADFNLFIKKYMNLITFCTLPVFGFFSWVFFRKYQRNYAEHVTIQIFAMAQDVTINVCLLLILLAAGAGMGKIALMSVFLTVTCYALTYYQFFRIEWYRALWKAILVYLMSYLVQIFLMMVAFVIFFFSVVK